MKIVNTKEIDKENCYIKCFYFDQNIQFYNILEFVKMYENENVKMIFARCSTYDDNGHPRFRNCYSIEDIIEFEKSSNNPGESYYIEFGTRDTGKYLFGISADINTKELMYDINKKKINEYNKESNKGYSR